MEILGDELSQSLLTQNPKQEAVQIMEGVPSGAAGIDSEESIGLQPATEPYSSEGKDAGNQDDGLFLENDLLGAAETSQIRVYRTRFLMLALFGLSSAANAIIWITFAPAASLVQTYYGINSTQVNALSIVFMAAYLPMTVVSSYIFQRGGIRVGITLACTLNCLSGLVRFLSTESNDAARSSSAYAILMLGQALGAIAQPFFTNLPARIGSLWFPPTERDLAVVIGSLANPIGIAVGSIIPALYTVGDDESIRMFDMLLMEFILFAIVWGLVAVLFRERPPTPPSLSESNRRQNDNNVWEEIRFLFAHRDFIILTICFGVLGLGLFNCLTTIMEQLIEPAGYSTDDASLFSGLLIGCGILSAVGVGIALDLTHKYNEILKGGFILSGIFLVAMVFLLRPNNLAALATIFALMGASMLPMLPLSFECGCECTYPNVREDVSSGVLMSAGQVSGIIYIVAIGTLLERQPVFSTYVLEPAYIIILVCTILFVVGIQFYRGKYFRLEAEQQQSLVDEESE